MSKAHDALGEELSFRKTIRKRTTSERIFAFWQIEMRKLPSTGFSAFDTAKDYLQWITQGYTRDFSIGSRMVKNKHSKSLTTSATYERQQFKLVLETDGRNLSEEIHLTDTLRRKLCNPASTNSACISKGNGGAPLRMVNRDLRTSKDSLNHVHQR